MSVSEEETKKTKRRRTSVNTEQDMTPRDSKKDKAKKEKRKETDEAEEEKVAEPLPDLPLVSPADTKFTSLPIDESLKSAIADMGFENMMPIQQQSIPVRSLSLFLISCRLVLFQVEICDCV